MQLACMLFELKTPPEFRKFQTSSSCHAQALLELLSFQAAHKRPVLVVVTDFTTGVRVWDVEGSVLVQHARDKRGTALSLSAGMDVCLRLLDREVGVTNALLDALRRQPMLPPPVLEDEGGSGDGDDSDEGRRWSRRSWRQRWRWRCSPHGESPRK